MPLKKKVKINYAYMIICDFKYEKSKHYCLTAELAFRISSQSLEMTFRKKILKNKIEEAGHRTVSIQKWL